MSRRQLDYLVTGLGIVGVALFILVVDQRSNPGNVYKLALLPTVVWTVALALLLLVRPRLATTPDEQKAEAAQSLEDPAIVKYLFSNPRAGLLWLPVRIYIGWTFLFSGWHKITGDTAIGWTKDGMLAGKAVQAGDNILGYWQRAVAIPQQGSPPIKYGWYRDFLQFMIDRHWNEWFSYLVSFGEVLIGLALVAGAFVGVAALFGGLMNFNFLLAGTVSTNPPMLAGAILLVMAWKTAGYIGLDRILLPALGAPWKPGRLVQKVGPAVGHGVARPSTR